jgi:hypothetical protein
VLWTRTKSVVTRKRSSTTDVTSRLVGPINHKINGKISMKQRTPALQQCPARRETASVTSIGNLFSSSAGVTRM